MSGNKIKHEHGLFEQPPQTYVDASEENTIKQSEIPGDQFKCPSCGGSLKYEPGTTSLKCPYCSSEIAIEQKDVEIKESDFHEHLLRLEQESVLQEIFQIKCSNCGAEITLPENMVSDECPYCTNPLIADQRISKKVVKPQYLLPFDANAKEANNMFKNWISGLWFAPNKLKKLARADRGVKGLYVPYWTYDAGTYTEYTGLRGDYYFEPELVTVIRNGQRVTEQRMVQKIAWTPVQGRVDLTFDDVLILGSASLPTQYAETLEPWDLKNLNEYDKRYLSGFMTESYGIDMKTGFDTAKQRMAALIYHAVLADIGGNVQQVQSIDTHYHDINFKHVLLPIWMNSYKFLGKLYRFLVNARTGEVQGERPYSWVKISFTILLAMAAFYMLAVFMGNVQ